MITGELRIMLVVLTMFAMINMLVMGCNQIDNDISGDSTLPTASYGSKDLQVESEDGSRSIIIGGVPFVLESAQYDGMLDAVRADIQYQQDSGEWISRTVILDYTEDDSYRFFACMQTQEGQLIVSVAVYYDYNQPNTVRIVERTPDDSLALALTVVEDTITEAYDQNGEEFTIVYMEAEFQRYQDLVDSLESGSNMAFGESIVPTYDGNTATLLAKFHAFTDFYDSENTLNNCREGELMIQLLDDVSFRDWLEVELGLQENCPSHLPPSTAARVCSIASKLTLKCWWGVWGNFICVSAVGVTAACLIAEVALACDDRDL